MSDLIQREGATAAAWPPDIGTDGASAAYPFQSLHSLDLEHFRGFSEPETIPFDKRYTFIYGPNGSGKSSVCEALEFAMLGFINECIERRIDIADYVRNSFTGASRPPVLKARTATGDLVEVSPNSSLYGFCFVEKNRIEDFGRISANTPRKKENLLATIFGLTEFNDFVAEFTKNFAEYIDTVGRNQRASTKSPPGCGFTKRI